MKTPTTRAADEAAVDVGLGQQLVGVLGVHGAAVLDGDGDIDGGLIGGAALKPDDFMAIINAANQPRWAANRPPGRRGPSCSR